MNRLKDKSCIITGVSEPRGIGFATAKIFAEEGATVLCVARRRMVYDRVEELKRCGHKAMGFVVDLSRPDAVNSFIRGIATKFERIDALVNVAGGSEGVKKNLVDMTEYDWNKVIDANLKTCMLCTRAVLPSMIGKRGGKIVNVSSVTGPIVAFYRSSAYSASKGGVSGFTRGLAMEVAEYGITVNAICPGYIDTGVVKNKRRTARSIPMKRLGRPEEVAYLALFLATEESDYITGTEIVIDGGNTIQESKAG
jgi:3-oxoacyl-[acyl-carrier protein] reductase